MVTPLFLDTAISSLIFYHLGHILFNSEHLRKPYNPLIAIATLTLLTFAILHLNVRVEMKDNIFPLYMILLALPMIYSCYQLSLSLTKIKLPCIAHLLATCGKSSLTIFGLHQALWLLLFPAVNNLSISPITSSVVLVIITLIILVICDTMINSQLAFIYGKSK
ncbi:MAG: hypothetical protein ACI4AM_00685 [Muribaculaceae bacterium]